MDRKVLLALAFTAVFVAGALLVLVAQQNPDPLAQFRTPDGKLTIPGGAMTRELQQLLFPPRPPENYYTYQPARSPYPTLLIQGIEHKTSEFAGLAARAEGPSGFIRPIAWLIGKLRPFLADALGFFTGPADAITCAGSCFWIGGSGNFSGAAHWSALSGGVTCVCTPQSTDTVTFDASSG